MPKLIYVRKYGICENLRKLTNTINYLRKYLQIFVSSIVYEW